MHAGGAEKFFRDLGRPST